ncbi:MAG: hypothetical protein LBE14_05105 [Treponema sp.]|nr:hypothetical protein [Treponema sp.]
MRSGGYDHGLFHCDVFDRFKMPRPRRPLAGAMEKCVYKWQEMQARKAHGEKLESARILKGMGLRPEQIQIALKLSPEETEAL